MSLLDSALLLAKRFGNMRRLCWTLRSFTASSWAAVSLWGPCPNGCAPPKPFQGQARGRCPFRRCRLLILA
eukprot:7613837-Alexandrium_andersonii.AAC.1